MMNKERSDGVSIVIASYNSAKRIGECLSHLANQKVVDGIPIEILLIDNNSHDRTSEIARVAWKDLGDPFPLRVISHEKPGVTGARLRGFEESRHRYAIICDDDNWLAPDYVRKVSDLFERLPEVGVLGGVAHPEPQTYLPTWFDDNKSLFACGHRELDTGLITGIDGWVWGAGMAFRLDVFDRLLEAGFTNAALGRTSSSMLCGEDVEWCHWFTIAGFGIWFDHSLQLTHSIEDRKLTDEYLMALTEGIKVSNRLLDDYYPVIRGTELREKSIYSHPVLVLRTLAKLLSGKNYQPEAVAMMPKSRFLLREGVRRIYDCRENFLAQR
jgi:glycosyltransferase involved in cell wall biosynthesis